MDDSRISLYCSLDKQDLVKPGPSSGSAFKGKHCVPIFLFPERFLPWGGSPALLASRAPCLWWPIGIGNPAKQNPIFIVGKLRTRANGICLSIVLNL